MCVTNAFPVILRSLDNGEQLIDHLRSTLNEDFSEMMCVSHMVTLYGQTYRTGTVVVMSADTDEPALGEIVLPQVDKSTALAFVRVVNVNFFDDHMYAYAVERVDEFKLVRIPCDLSDFRPLDLYTGFRGNEIYINPRYVLLC